MWIGEYGAEVGEKTGKKGGAIGDSVVINRRRPAPFPKSEIAGVTSPIMMSGMANVRKFANTALNVTNIFAIGNGMNCPKTIARMIA